MENKSFKQLAEEAAVTRNELKQTSPYQPSWAPLVFKFEEIKRVMEQSKRELNKLI